jgi:stage III sporulation protein AE
MVVRMKKIIILILLLILIPNTSLATEQIIEEQMEALNLGQFIQEGEKYTKDAFPEISIKELITQSLTGKVNNSLMYKAVLKILGKEIVSSITIIGSILAIIVIHSILKSISENLGNNNTSQIAYFVEYILIITMIMANFAVIIESIKNTISNLVGFMNCLVPILISLIIATGQVASGAVLQPILIFAVIFIGNIINLVILPITTASMILSIASNISDKVQIGNLAKFFKSSITWFLGFIITIFVGLLSLEGTLTSSVDGITIKGIKSAASTFIPVVGKALGDSVDTVLGATSLIKNSVGFVGIVIVIAICILPIVKLIILNIMYSLLGAVSEPLADKKIVNVIGQVSGVFKILLGIMFFVSVLLIVGIALTLKISNASLMYR